MTETGSAGVSIETLKRIKEAEETADRRLAQVRADGAALLAKARADAAAMIHQAKVAGESSRTGAVAGAKTAAEAEATKLLAEGRKAAELIGQKAGTAIAAKKEQVLNVVLGGFRPGDEA